MDDAPSEPIRLTAEQWAAVEAALHQRTLVPRVRERLEMVTGVARGQDLAAIARWTGRTQRTVRRWLGRFRSGGVAAVADAPRSGRPARADAAYMAALETAADTAPLRRGFPCDVWTSARLSAYLAETTGVRIAPGWVRALVARQHWASGRPKHTLTHLQDPDEVAACEATLAEVETNRGGRSGAHRTASPGCDPPGDQSVSGPGVAPARGAAAGARGRDESARDDVRERGGVRAGAGGSRPRGAGLGRVRALSGSAGGAA